MKVEIDIKRETFTNTSQRLVTPTRMDLRVSGPVALVFPQTAVQTNGSWYIWMCLLGRKDFSPSLKFYESSPNPTSYWLYCQRSPTETELVFTFVDNEHRPIVPSDFDAQSFAAALKECALRVIDATIEHHAHVKIRPSFDLDSSGSALVNNPAPRPLAPRDFSYSFGVRPALYKEVETANEIVNVWFDIPEIRERGVSCASPMCSFVDFKAFGWQKDIFQQNTKSDSDEAILALYVAFAKELINTFGMITQYPKSLVTADERPEKPRIYQVEQTTDITLKLLSSA